MVSSYSLLSYMHSLNILTLPNISVGVISYFKTADIEVALVWLLQRNRYRSNCSCDCSALEVTCLPTVNWSSCLGWGISKCLKIMKKIFFGECAEHGKIIFSRFAGGSAMLQFESDSLRFLFCLLSNWGFKGTNDDWKLSWKTCQQPAARWYYYPISTKHWSSYLYSPPWQYNNIATNFNSGETCIDVGSSLWQTGGGRCNSDGSRPG